MSDIPVELHDGPSLAELRRDNERRRARIGDVLNHCGDLSECLSRMPGATLDIHITADLRDVIAAGGMDGAESFTDGDRAGVRFHLDDGAGTVTIVEARP